MYVFSIVGLVRVLWMALARGPVTGPLVRGARGPVTGSLVNLTRAG